MHTARAEASVYCIIRQLREVFVKIWSEEVLLP